MKPIKPGARGRATIYWPAAVALIVGIVFSGVAFWAMRGWERAAAMRQTEASFRDRAEDVSMLLQQAVTRQLTAAEGVEALFEASQDVTRDEFETFTRGLLAQNPGIRRIAWAPRVADADRQAFEQSLDREVAGYRVHASKEGSSGALLYPIAYVAPSDAAGDLGLDLGSVPVVREALVHASTTGRGTTAGPIPLTAVGGDGVGAAFLLPFYRSSSPLVAPVLQGFVAGLIDLTSVVVDTARGEDVWLLDGAGRPVLTVQEGRQVPPAEPPSHGYVRRTGLTIGDQVWTLALAPPAGAVPAVPGRMSWAVLVVGVVASVAGATYLSRLRRFNSDLSAANVALNAEMSRRQEAERTRQRLSEVIEATVDLVAMADAGGHLLYLNHAGHVMVGIPDDEDVSRVLLSDLLTPASRASLPARDAAGDEWRGELVLQRRGGGEIPALCVVQTHRDEAGAMEYRSAIAHDIRDRKAAERDLERHAYYDELTGLPNRLLLERRLAETIAAADGKRVGVLLLHPDRFRFVSFSLGPGYRDLTMAALARRLEALVRPGETLARYVGDTFALVLPDAGVARVHRVEDALFEAMAEPLRVDGAEVLLGLSVGACFYPDDGKDVPALLRAADAALNEAAELGGGRARFFTESLSRRLQDRLALEEELRGALERGELTLYYQPQLDIATGQLVGVEALLRWRHPRLGLLTPDRFIHAAEDSRLIVPIGAWVLDRACVQARAWREAGLPSVRLGVNVSSYQLGQSDLEARIGAAMRQGGLAPHELELELTESALLADPEEVRALLGRLRAVGCGIAIDDFGTGYSSLSYLKQLPVDRLKIDQSFVRDVTTDPRSAGIVRTIVALAGDLGISTIAEGVGNRAQADFLEKAGCPELQGYFVSPPVPPEDVPKLEAKLRTHAPATA